jgi:hypothetical protein
MNRMRNRMFKRLIIIAGLLALPIAANAQNPPTPPSVAVLGGHASLAVTTGTARVALPVAVATFPAVTLINDGANEVFFKLGASSVTAAVTDVPLPAGASVTLFGGPNTYVAAITSSSTSTLRVIQFNGSPYFFGGGGLFSGTIGSVTQGTSPWVTAPATATTTIVGSTIAASGVFQTALAASATRLGCTLQNQGASPMYVFPGALGSATEAASFIVAPGGSISCNVSGVVITDAINVTGMVGDAYVISNQ